MGRQILLKPKVTLSMLANRCGFKGRISYPFFFFRSFTSYGRQEGSLINYDFFFFSLSAKADTLLELSYICKEISEDGTLLGGNMNPSVG